MNERAQLVTATPMVLSLHDPFAGAVYYSAPGATVAVTVLLMEARV